MTRSLRFLTSSGILTFFFALFAAISAVFWVTKSLTTDKIAPFLQSTQTTAISTNPDTLALGLGSDPLVQAPSEPAIASRLKLVGIIAGQPQGVALISIDDGLAVPYSMGRLVLDGWSLSKVLPKSVELTCATCSSANTVVQVQLPAAKTASFTIDQN